MEYYYKGDVKKLIPNGWKFQKLYARNYKSYHKGCEGSGIWLFVISKMCIEIDNVKRKDQPTLVKFILDNLDKPQDFWEKKSSSFFKDTFFAEWVLQDGRVVTTQQAMDNKVKWMLTPKEERDIKYLEDGFHIEYEFVGLIKNLIEIGEVTCS